MEQRPLPDGGFEMLVVPAIVCVAFSCELGLKALAAREGVDAWGHSLAKLFRQLSPGLQIAIASDVGSARTDFDAALAAASDAFERWRYVHESPSASADIAFLHALARAIQKGSELAPVR